VRKSGTDMDISPVPGKFDNSMPQKGKIYAREFQTGFLFPVTERVAQVELGFDSAPYCRQNKKRQC